MSSSCSAAVINNEALLGKLEHYWALLRQSSQRGSMVGKRYGERLEDCASGQGKVRRGLTESCN